jgi:hypothetical protein
MAKRLDLTLLKHDELGFIATLLKAPGGDPLLPAPDPS